MSRPRQHARRRAAATRPRRGAARSAVAGAPTRAQTVVGAVRVTPFPGHLVQAGEPDADVVRTLQRRLNAVGCGPVAEDGVFGPQTDAAVRLFQSRFPDPDGQPLQIDGRVGAITWSALFGRASTPTPPPAGDELIAAALRAAASHIGTMEVPPGSNRGPEVDRWLRGVGLDPTKGSYPWCAAFVYGCFDEAAKQMKRKNPVIRTAGVLDHWARARTAGVPVVTAPAAHVNESLVLPGMIFVIDTGAAGGAGHTGLVEAIDAGKLVTIEGNTNDGGAREGVGVFRRSGRRIRDVNVGFIDYAGR